MRDTTDTRALIDIARELLNANDAYGEAKERRDKACETAHAHGIRSSSDAALFVRGHEAAVAFFRSNILTDYSDALERANARIADLEAQLAARPQVVGVVVDDAMVERFMSHYAGTEQWREKMGDDAEFQADWYRDHLTAALRTAHTVPLESVEPVAWRNITHDITYRDKSSARAFGGDIAPLFKGFSESAQRGEG